MGLGSGDDGCVQGRAGYVLAWPWAILSVWCASSMAWHLLPVGARVRTSGSKKLLWVPETGQVSFSRAGGCSPDVDPHNCQT